MVDVDSLLFYSVQINRMGQHKKLASSQEMQIVLQALRQSSCFQLVAVVGDLVGVHHGGWHFDAATKVEVAVAH